VDSLQTVTSVFVVGLKVCIKIMGFVVHVQIPHRIIGFNKILNFIAVQKFVHFFDVHFVGVDAGSHLSVLGNFNQFLTKIFVVFLKHFTFGCGKIALQCGLNALHLRFKLIAVHGNTEKIWKGEQNAPQRESNQTVTGFSSSFLRAVLTKRPTEPFSSAISPSSCMVNAEASVTSYTYSRPPVKVMLARLSVTVIPLSTMALEPEKVKVRMVKNQ